MLADEQGQPAEAAPGRPPGDGTPEYGSRDSGEAGPTRLLLRG